MELLRSEAIRLVDMGKFKPEDIDTALKNMHEEILWLREEVERLRDALSLTR